MPSLFKFFLFSTLFASFSWTFYAEPESSGPVDAAQESTTPDVKIKTLASDTTAPNAETPSEDEGLSGTNALLQKLKESGNTGLTLLIVSIVGFSFAFERVFNLKKSAVVPSGLAAKADQLWQNKDMTGLRECAKKSKSTLGRVIIEIVDHQDSSKNDISTMAGDIASREMRLHLQRAYPLAVVATISPLLGLFGTVYGMIGAFESVAMAGAMGDPSIMASDIAYALMTTAIGLVIAVPALSCYHFFRIRTNLLGLSLEEQASHLISRWFKVPSQKVTSSTDSQE